MVYDHVQCRQRKSRYGSTVYHSEAPARGRRRGGDACVRPAPPPLRIRRISRSSTRRRRRYTVQKGDTLWGISGRFLKDPWRWPDIWRLNKDQIKNPHLIYPGDVVKLDYVNGQPQLTLMRNGVRVSSLRSARRRSTSTSSRRSRRATSSPTCRSRSSPAPTGSPARRDPLRAQPAADGPRPRRHHLRRGPRSRRRATTGTSTVPADRSLPGTARTCWATRANFIGTARVEKLRRARHGAHRVGERRRCSSATGCCPRRARRIANYVPRAPDKAIDARILYVPDTNTETGRGYIVTIDKGKADGLEPGNVLAVYRAVEPIVDPRPNKQQSAILRFLDRRRSSRPRCWLRRPTSGPASCSCSARSTTCRTPSCSTPRNRFVPATTAARPSGRHRVDRRALQSVSPIPADAQPAVILSQCPSPPRPRRPGRRCRSRPCPTPRWSRCCARSAVPRRVLAATRAQLRAVVPDDVAARVQQAVDQDALAATRAGSRIPRTKSSRGTTPTIRARCSNSGFAPPALFFVGRRELLNRPALAIVGSRNATRAGRDERAGIRARRSPRAGLTIVSGLAVGIDAAAHEGALEGDGSTLAVVGTGPRPRVSGAQSRARASHRRARRIDLRIPARHAAAQGKFSAPQPLDQRPCARRAGGRGALSSGSLITARYAGEQGRDVFAIPGSIHSPLSKGCHKLIREGAKLVETAQDILEELGMGAPARAAASAPRRDAPTPTSRQLARARWATIPWTSTRWSRAPGWRPTSSWPRSPASNSDGSAARCRADSGSGCMRRIELTSARRQPCATASRARARARGARVGALVQKYVFLPPSSRTPGSIGVPLHSWPRVART